MLDGITVWLVLLLTALLAAMGTLWIMYRRLLGNSRALAGEVEVLRRQMGERAIHYFEEWKGRELQAVVQQQREVASREAQAQLLQWKLESTEQIRKEAVHKSRSVTLGKVVEHIAPFSPLFPFNPRDARFIGNPVDFVIFDGATEGEVRRVVLVEVKSGLSTLTTKQRKIRDAVQEGRVEWQEVRV